MKGSCRDRLGILLMPSAGRNHPSSGPSWHSARSSDTHCFPFQFFPDTASFPTRRVVCITDALTPLTKLGAQSTLSEGVDRWENRHPVEREVAGCCECVCGGEGPKCKLSEAEITIDYKILLASKITNIYFVFKLISIVG